MVGGDGTEGEGRKEEGEDLLHYLLGLYLQYDDKDKNSKSKSTNGNNGTSNTTTSNKANGNTSDDEDESDKTGGGTSGGGTGGGAKSTYIAPTDDNLRDVLINMFQAGRDTTASAINWCIYRYI